MKKIKTKTEKVCCSCNQVKPISEFYKRTKRYKNNTYKFFSYCKPCELKKVKKYQERHKKEISERARLHRLNNLGLYKTRGREKIIKKRLEIINKYGGKCACCGESKYEFLAIDHVNNDGNIHRKKIGHGSSILHWLSKNNYPEGYQVLCHNCNLAKAFYGKCPHKK